MFSDLEFDLLRDIHEAEMRGKYLTHSSLGSRVRGSTFEDLWAANHISIRGQSGLIQFFDQDSEYVLTESGKRRLAEFESRQKN
jgi:hypothetical protein